MLIYAVQDEFGQWHIDPGADQGQVDGWFESALTVTEGRYAGRRAVRYASIEGHRTRLRYQLDDYQRFYPTVWVQQLLDWEDPKVAADPVGELSKRANRIGGFSAEDIAEVEAAQAAEPE